MRVEGWYLSSLINYKKWIRFPHPLLEIHYICLDARQPHGEGVWAHGRERRMRIVIKADAATRQPRIVCDE